MKLYDLVIVGQRPDAEFLAHVGGMHTESQRMSRIHPADYAESLFDGRFPALTEGDKVLIGLWMVAEALSDGLLGIRTAIAPIECGPKANLVEGMMEAVEVLGKEIANAVTYHADSSIN